MSEYKTNYRSYLLRLWRENKADTSWRAMLENITDPSQRRYFTNLESLAAYLLEWVEDDTKNTNGGE